MKTVEKSCIGENYRERNCIGWKLQKKVPMGENCTKKLHWWKLQKKELHWVNTAETGIALSKNCTKKSSTEENYKIKELHWGKQQKNVDSRNVLVDECHFFFIDSLHVMTVSAGSEQHASISLTLISLESVRCWGMKWYCIFLFAYLLKLTKDKRCTQHASILFYFHLLGERMMPSADNGKVKTNNISVLAYEHPFSFPFWLT